MTSISIHAGSVKQVPFGDGIRAFQFDRDGVPMTMIWSNRRQLIRRPISGGATVRDIMGNLRSTIEPGSTPELSIGPDPILLIGGRIKTEETGL